MPLVRKIIEIDEDLCTGCGDCIPSCAEGALAIVDGKARLVKDLYCDGLGACLGECPTGALQLIEREADPFDEEAVEERLAGIQAATPESATGPAEFPLACGCPSSAAMDLAAAGSPAPTAAAGEAASTLGHWPIKLQLLNPGAPFLKGADLLLLADCTAAALPDLHSRLLAGKAVALACPKLDNAQAHIDRLAAILAEARPASVTVAHMEVPCCKGLEVLLERAMDEAGYRPALGKIVVGRDGKVLEDQEPARSAA